jgi:hypothetical protein
MGTTTTNISGCTFLIEDYPASVGVAGKRTIGVSGRMIDKRKTVEKGSIPDPLSGKIPQGLGLDRGHLIAEELGGPNISANIVPMYAHFNRKGAWKGLERQLARVLDERAWVGIMIDYDASKPWLPVAFRVQTATAAVALPFSGNGNEGPGTAPLMMRLYPPSAYAGDPVVRQRVQAVLPATRDAFSPYAFMDDYRRAWGLPMIQPTQKFNAVEREYVKVANSLFNHGRPGEQGFLTSDGMFDTHKVLNHQGNEDFPEVDHMIPKSWGGSNAFANAQLVSWKMNSTKRADLSEAQKKEILERSDREKKDRGIGTRGKGTATDGERTTKFQKTQ